MGYTIGNVKKAVADNKWATAFNNAMHLKSTTVEVQAILADAYKAIKEEKATMEDTRVLAGVKEVNVMLGIENQVQVEEVAPQIEEVVEEEFEEPQVGGITRVKKEEEELVEEKAVEETVEEVKEVVEEVKDDKAPEYDPWVLVTGMRKDKTALFVTVFEGDSRAKLTELQKEGHTFVCLSKVTAFNKFLGNEFKGGKGIVQNLNRKGVDEVSTFVTNILSYATQANDGMTITIGIDGWHQGQDTVTNDEGKEEVV